MKIKNVDGFDESAPKVRESGSWMDASSEFRHADPVKFGELVASLGLDYEEGCWITLHKLVGSWSRFPHELEVGRNQSV